MDERRERVLRLFVEAACDEMSKAARKMGLGADVPTPVRDMMRARGTSVVRGMSREAIDLLAAAPEDVLAETVRRLVREVVAKDLPS